MEYLVYSTAFYSLFCVSIVLFFGWQKRGHLSRNEKIVLFLSGLCTAYIIPASTLIMSLPISILVAMVLMRGSVIIASRAVDFVLERQGLQHKSIPWQEELAVVFAILAVVTKIFFSNGGTDQFPFIGIVLLFCYFFAYLLRLYIMNRAKLLGVGGKTLDQRLYFGMEQLFASGILVAVSIPIFLFTSRNLDSTGILGQQYVRSISDPHPQWFSAAVSGLPYGFIAFLSVFLFLFPGKSATFTGVLNRVVSLLAGTTSSLILYLFFGGVFPPNEDWIALAFIVGSILLLAWGHQNAKRAEVKTPARS